jgi:hypothetical protein
MIDDSVLAGRIPRLGTISTGRGVEATARSGSTYGRPTREKTLVFHTNDVEIAEAVRSTFGGTIETDSPTWEFDVVTGVREAPITALAGGFRQSLEAWRAAECLRRCDGVTMSTADGRPSSEPCRCDVEMARGQDRLCSPSTILPALVDLPVERFGVWEIRSTGWGTAAAIKGAMSALAMVGAASSQVPAVLSMVDRTTRDASGEVRDVVELHLTLALGPDALTAIATGERPALPAPPVTDDDRRQALMETWSDLHARASRLGLRDHLADDYRDRYGGVGFDELTVGQLGEWVELVADTVAEHEQILRSEAAEAAGDGPRSSLPPVPAEPGTSRPG